MGGKRSSARKVLAMEREQSDIERTEPEGSGPPGMDPQASDAETERSEPAMKDSSNTSVPPILKRPRVLALIGALVILVIVLITACGGGDNAADPGAETSTVDIVDSTTDLGPEPDTTLDETTTEAPSDQPPVIAPADLPITKVKGKPLKRGMGNKRVMAFQEGLIYLGFLEAGSADGKFGQKTKKAVQEFQLEMGLNGDGVAGPKTIRAINKAVKQAPAGGEVQPATEEPVADEPGTGTEDTTATEETTGSG